MTPNDGPAVSAAENSYVDGAETTFTTVWYSQCHLLQKKRRRNETMVILVYGGVLFSLAMWDNNLEGVSMTDHEKRIAEIRKWWEGSGSLVGHEEELLSICDELIAGDTEWRQAAAIFPGIAFCAEDSPVTPKNLADYIKNVLSQYDLRCKELGGFRDRIAELEAERDRLKDILDDPNRKGRSY